MASALKLMAILAHPDDESLGVGGILTKYAADGWPPSSSLLTLMADSGSQSYERAYFIIFGQRMVLH